MTQTSQEDNKGRIMSAFHQLLTEHEAIASKVATKEEEVEKAKHRELLETAANYTVDSIVNGTAALQLDFGETVTSLADRLLDESAKLDALKKAITIERNNLDQLQKVRVVADALYLLRKEHDERLTMLETNINRQMEEIEGEMTQQRKSWAKEQAEFDSKIKDQETLITKQRQQELEDHNYEIERARRIETDEYEEAKRIQERTLLFEKQKKEKDWKGRETYLTEKQTEFEEYQAQIVGFEKELKEIYEDEKNKAIEQANRDAKVKVDLIEREWTAEKQGYELRITALETAIQRQVDQISELTTQLQTATNQAQNLAMRAFQSSNG